MLIPFAVYIISCLVLDIIKYIKIKRIYCNKRRISEYNDFITTIISLTNLIVLTLILNKFEKHLDKFGSFDLIKILIMFLLADTIFYWSHRFLHIPIIYNLSHILHHRHIYPISWDALYIHPLEFLINIISIFILPVIFWPLIGLNRCSQINATIYWTFIIFGLVISHSGLKLFFMHDEHHDLHHQRKNYNFGSKIGIWDKICNTNYIKQNL